MWRSNWKRPYGVVEGTLLLTCFSFKTSSFYNSLGGHENDCMAVQKEQAHRKESKISPHYGPCNLRVRCHFPLIVPEGDCGMQVGDKNIKWEEGVPLFFDDCYEHHGRNRVQLCVWSFLVNWFEKYRINTFFSANV